MSDRYDHWINGAWVAPNSGLYLESRSPVDDGLVAEIARGDDFDVAHAAATARAAQPAWAATSPKARSAVLSAIARAMNEDRDHLVELERSETGKPLDAAIDEIATAVDYFEYYAALIRSFSGDVIDVGENQHIFTRREPYGVVATITPWNVPITQAARSIAPAHRCRQRGRRQTLRVHLVDDARGRANRIGGRPPRRRAERHHRYRPGGW